MTEIWSGIWFVEMGCSQDPGKAPETPPLATHASVGGLSTWVAGEDTWEGLGTGAVVTGSARGGEGELAVQRAVMVMGP